MKHILAQISTFKHFSKSVHYIFLKFYLVTGIKKWVRVTVFDFWEKILFCPKLGEWYIFRPKVNFLNFPRNLFTRFFFRYLINSNKKWVKVTILDFLKENCYYAQNGRNGLFFGQKSTPFNFSINLLGLPKIVPDYRH